MLATNSLLKKTPFQALVDIVNYNNGLNIQPGNVVFENMIPLDGRRTQITIRALPVSGGVAAYTGQKTFVYKRLHVDESFSDADKNLTIRNPDSTQSLLNILADRYGILIDTSDFIIESIPSGATSYVLKANPASLRWVGQTTIAIIEPPPAIEDEITVVVLNGLVYDGYSPNVAANAELLFDDIMDMPSDFNDYI